MADLKRHGVITWREVQAMESNASGMRNSLRTTAIVVLAAALRVTVLENGDEETGMTADDTTQAKAPVWRRGL